MSWAGKNQVNHRNYAIPVDEGQLNKIPTSCPIKLPNHHISNI